MQSLVDIGVFNPNGPTLFGSRCSACGALHHPPRDVCPECLSDSVERCSLACEGEIVALTHIRLKDPGLIEPRVVGEVRLDDGICLFAPVDLAPDGSPPVTGARVRLAAGPVRHDPGGEEIVGYRFQPKAA
jgi:uncharacterized OB-fold protein